MIYKQHCHPIEETNMAKENRNSILFKNLLKIETFPLKKNFLMALTTLTDFFAVFAVPFSM